MINDNLEKRKIINVLLVEDEPIIQKVHVMMLQKLGCFVELAIDGKQALEKASYNYDLIFMDMGLPEVSGADITEQIRSREKIFKHTPIIMLTGYSQKEIHELCLKNGADAVYTKPIDINIFQKILQNYIK